MNEPDTTTRPFNQHGGLTLIPMPGFESLALEVTSRVEAGSYEFDTAIDVADFEFGYRASGEPYITHPIAVAGLCAEWKLDAQAIMAALMHDAMEDCGVTKVELVERFGVPTAELVDGCLLYTSPSPRDVEESRMPSSA